MGQQKDGPANRRFARFPNSSIWVRSLASSRSFAVLYLALYIEPYIKYSDIAPPRPVMSAITSTVTPNPNAIPSTATGASGSSGLTVGQAAKQALEAYKVRDNTKGTSIYVLPSARSPGPRMSWHLGQMRRRMSDVDTCHISIV